MGHERLCDLVAKINKNDSHSQHLDASVIAAGARPWEDPMRPVRRWCQGIGQTVPGCRAFSRSGDISVKIGVVIPYFQREAGLLARALASVFGQELPAGAALEVVVVDDGSPAPVEPELAGLGPGARAAVTVLRQANAGPGAARNRALDHLAATGASHVAFLDSDDLWAPRHLAEAAEALGLGFELYFCAHKRAQGAAPQAAPGPAPDSAPDSASGPDGGDGGDGGDRELARLRRPGEGQVAWLRPDASLIGVESERLLLAHLAAYVSQTSTVVVSLRALGSLRFDTGLRGAGEDQLLWIELALAGHGAVISSALNVTCGRGVNLYHSAFDFGSVKVVERVGYLLLFWRQVRAKLQARGLADPGCEQGLARYRRAYSYLFVRALLRRQLPPLRQLRALLAQEPLLLLGMPVRFLLVLPHRNREAPTW